MDGSINQNFPYQIVTFLGAQPSIGEQIYNSPNGWYPQVALKRRFCLNGTTEGEFIEQLESYFGTCDQFRINSKQLIKPQDMPVQVVELEHPQAVINFHNSFIDHFDDRITSKYPQREGKDYYPHITAEYYDRLVIDVDAFSGRSFHVDAVCLVKDDPETDDSRVYRYFRLGSV